LSSVAMSGLSGGSGQYRSLGGKALAST